MIVRGLWFLASEEENLCGFSLEEELLYKTQSFNNFVFAPVVTIVQVLRK